MCSNLPAGACQETPRAFVLNAFNGFCTKLAEQLASPGVVFSWLFAVLGVPVGLTALLIPFKNMGSLLPQLFVSARIRAFARRKYFWVGAGATQGLLLLLLALLLPSLTGLWAGIIILAIVLLFNVASGVGSISFKDVLAKTIPEGKRGRLLATRATGGGALTLAAGLYFYSTQLTEQGVSTYVWLIAIAGALWLLSSLLFARIPEAKGATEGGRSTWQELRSGFRLLQTDTNFRRFLIARGLLMGIPLAQPFLVMYARQTLQANLRDLGLFVIISGLSALISSPFWGRFSDRSSRGLMVGIALFGAAILGYVLAFGWLPDSYQSVWTFAPAFFLLAMAHGGARLGRKTYLVDYAPKDNRPLYVSVANTTIGLITLLTGGIGLLAQYFSFPVLFGFLAASLLAAAALGRSLKKVGN